MNLLMVDSGANNFFAEISCNNFYCIRQVEWSMLDDSCVIAKKIHGQKGVETQDNLSSKADLAVILVNIEEKFGGARRQDQKGVEIVIWLRCKFKVINPIVLFGWQESQQLLKKKPENLIIHSEGTSYYRLPTTPKKLLNNEFQPVRDWHGLKAFLKPAFNLEQVRHEHANWWGMKSLCDIHQIFVKGSLSLAYPVNLKGKDLNKALLDINFTVGVFLFENIDGLKRIYNDTVLKEKQLIVDHQICHEQIKNLNEEVEVTNDILKDISLNLLLNSKKLMNKDIYSEFFLENLSIEKAKLEDELGVTERHLETATIEINKNRQLYNQLSKQLTRLQDIAISTLNSDQKKPEDLTKHLAAKKILLIDDQWEDGWYVSYCRVLYNQDSHPNFTAVKAADELRLDDNDSLLTGQPFMPDLILLDLQLNPQEDKNFLRDFDKLSGARLLKKIRESHAGIPILITTASNKVWSFRELLKLGADAFWIKEGIDAKFSAMESYENYNTFLNTIKKLTSNKYLILNNLSIKLNQFKKNNNYWWIRKHIWQNGQETAAVDKDVIIDIITNFIPPCRTFLQQDIQKYDNISRPFWFSSLINKLAGVVEEIHFDKNKDANDIYSTKIGGYYNPNTRKWQVHRGDYTGQMLLSLRNPSSHHLWGSKLNDFEILQKTILLFIHYLDQDHLYPKIPPTYPNFNSGWKFVKQSIDEFIYLNNISNN